MVVNFFDSLDDRSLETSVYLRFTQFGHIILVVLKQPLDENGHVTASHKNREIAFKVPVEFLDGVLSEFIPRKIFQKLIDDDARAFIRLRYPLSSPYRPCLLYTSDAADE